MGQIAEEPAGQFPDEIQTLLKSALALRDRLEAKQISPLGARIAQGRLKGRLSRLLEPDQDDPANQRLAKHLRRSEKELFVFLDHPEVEATNWPSEQAIRPAVINRKTCAGNRTAAGAHSQEILVSVLRTCHQRGLKAPQVFSQILRDPTRQAHRELTSIPPAR
jgi:hypothetical protein